MEKEQRKFPFSLRPIEMKHAPKNRRSFFLSLSLFLSSFHHSSSIVNQPRDALNARDDARPSVPCDRGNKKKKRTRRRWRKRKRRRRRKVDTCKKNSASETWKLCRLACTTRNVPREMFFGRFLPLSRGEEGGES